MSLRHALLGLLAESPMSGYDLTKRFEHSLGLVWPARHNQIYTELKGLLRDELIVLTDYGPRGRKIYAVTEAGIAACRDWLTAGPETIDRAMRFEPLLRLNFVWLLEPEAARAVLGREMRHYRDAAAWLAQQQAGLPDDADDRSVRARRRVAAIGIRLYAAMAEEIETLADALTDDPDGGEGAE